MGGIAGGVARELVQFGGAIVVAGVVLAYAERLAKTARHLAERIAGPRGGHFLEIAASTIRNVANGVIGIALLQAALLGLGMVGAGIPFAGALTLVGPVLAVLQIRPNPAMSSVIIRAWRALPGGV